MKIKVKKTHPDAELPVYATEGAGCFDLRACLPDTDHIAIHYGKQPAIDTGLAFEIPAGHVMLVFSRSGHGFKNDVRLSNCVGVIDSDYRGSVKVKLKCDNELTLRAWGPEPLKVYHGDRIAQALVLPVQQVTFDVVEELSETARGANGIGSTGAC